MDESNVNMPQPVEQPQPAPVQPEPQQTAPVNPPMPQQPVTPIQPVMPPQPPVNNWQPAPTFQPVQTEQMLPPEYRPLSPWAYFGYQLLFGIPLVGFIMLIVFSCSNDNINRRNFARSYWCALAIGAIVGLVFIILASALGVGVATMYR